MIRWTKRIGVLVGLMTLFIMITGCGFSGIETVNGPDPIEKNGEVYILYTSDVHCGIDQGFGYAGLQVSGLTYEIDMSIPSGCKADKNGMMKKIEGPRRVKNVKVGDEPIDPKKTYTLAGTDYVILKSGDGYTCFKNAKILRESDGTTLQALLNYIQTTLGGTIGNEYEDPYGQGRIVFTEQRDE